jgi:dual specificity phosphatase 12
MPLLINDKPHISEVEPGLFIGDFTSSSQPSTLKENGITAIVSLANNRSEEWSRPGNRDQVPEDKHLFVSCADTSSQDILVLLPEICDFIDRHSAHLGTVPESQHRNGDQSNVLVHCTAGVSRSAAIVVAYLMRKHRQGAKEVLKHVKEKRRIQPSENFMEQLDIWERVEYEPWEDEERKRPKEPYREFLSRKETHTKARSAQKERLSIDRQASQEQSNFVRMYAQHHAQQQ